ncbi:unnamed protein product [Strongylus vulgaris]|uniref:Uncharacterized protein n=1 Tax=Strongylus vulgaris TaxID=40348 RepID=A0A3P7LPQ8_STRVU|nr:unnamed protein product [Strongylus vulgaris]
MRIVPFHQRFTLARPPPNGFRLMRQCPRRRGFRSRWVTIGLAHSAAAVPEFALEHPEKAKIFALRFALYPMRFNIQ